MKSVKRVFMVNGKPFYPIGGQSHKFERLQRYRIQDSLQGD